MIMLHKKIITALLAAVMMMAAFLTPMAAYAAEPPELPPNLTMSDIEKMDLGELLEYFTLTEILNLFSVFNITGDGEDNGSEVEPPEPEPTDPPAGESEADDPDLKPFTPDGQASVVDLAYEGDGKMFYTFKTPAGNVFYLIIDRQRGGENVYFLNAVTEQDLIALTDGAISTGDKNVSAIPTDPKTGEPDPNGKDDKPADPKTDPADPPAKKGGNTGMLVFLLIGVAAVGGAAYYIKIIRPKQQGGTSYDDEDEPNEDDGEEMEFEDEPEDADEYEDSDDGTEEREDAE